METQRMLSFPTTALAKLMGTAKSQQSHQPYDKYQGKMELLLWSSEVTTNVCVLL